VAIGFNGIVKEHLKAAEGLKIKTEAMLNAASTFNTLIYLILTGEKTQREYILQDGDGFLNITNIPLDGGEVIVNGDVRISIRSSNSMLSLTSLNKSALRRLIGSLSGEDATGVIESYLDWIDKDEFVRINGAEDYYYKSEGVPYGPRNYPVQYKDEFALVKGMSEEIFRKVRPYITILPSLGFNPNTASKDVLMAYLDIANDTAGSLMAYMARKSISSDMELFSITGRKIVNDEGVYFYPSPFLEVTIKVGIPDTIHTIHAGVDTRQNIYLPYSIMHWREE
jgi:general secretion pathway protein K